MTEAAVKKLSRVQKRMLLDLLTCTRQVELHGGETARNELRFWGVRWSVLRRNLEKSPAVCAAHSRALRRLERRGLVVRSNDNSGVPCTGKRAGQTRTTRVRLTDLGRGVAESLTAAEESTP